MKAVSVHLEQTAHYMRKQRMVRFGSDGYVKCQADLSS